MVDIETFKDELTGKARSIYDNFKKTGEDDVFYLGQIAQGKAGVVTLADIIHRAQVFANPEFRGRIGSCTSFRAFNIPVVKGALDGSIKGLKNNGFTSHIVADKKVGLSDLRESYAIGSRLFFETTVTTDISAYECSLENIAKSIKEDVKTSFFSRSKEQSMTIKKPSSKNKLCDLMDEIYQVVDKKNKETFDTDLEKATSNILATWLVSRAMNLSTGDKDNQNEKKLDEAMKLQFYTHLNGCSNNGHCAISKIIKQGVQLGLDMIDSMNLSSADIKEKRDRLGITTKDEQVQDALFGAQCAAEPNPVAEQKPEAEPESNAEQNAYYSEEGNDLSFEFDDLFDDDDSDDKTFDDSYQTNEQSLNSTNDSTFWPDLYNGKWQKNINERYEEFVKKNGYDPFSGKKASRKYGAIVAGLNQKVVDKNARILGVNEKAVGRNDQVLDRNEKAVSVNAHVWDPAGFGVRSKTLKKAVANSVLSKIEEKQNKYLGKQIGLFYRGVAISIRKFFKLQNNGGTDLPSDHKSKDYVHRGMNYGENICQNLDWVIDNVSNQYDVQEKLKELGNNPKATQFFKNQVAKEYYQDRLTKNQRTTEQPWETFARMVAEDAGEESGLMIDKKKKSANEK